MIIERRQLDKCKTPSSCATVSNQMVQAVISIILTPCRYEQVGEFSQKLEAK